MREEPHLPPKGFELVMQNPSIIHGNCKLVDRAESWLAHLSFVIGVFRQHRYVQKTDKDKWQWLGFV